MLMKDTFNFLINQLNYSQRYNGSFYCADRSSEPFDFFKELIRLVKKKLNIISFGEILTEEYQQSTYGVEGEEKAIFDFYCTHNAINKEICEQEYTLILLSHFFNFKKDLGMLFKDFISEYNKIISKYSLEYSYKNKDFKSLAPLLQNSEDYGLLNFSKDVKEKYIFISKEYEEAFNEYNKGQYKEAIWKSFSSLESLIKIKMGEKNIEFIETDGFARNISKMFENNIFKGFLIKENLISLGSIRNNHGGHGSSNEHVEDIDFTYFYLYNIANTLLYISKL